MEYEFCLLNISWLTCSPAWHVLGGMEEMRLNSVALSFGKGMCKLPQMEDYIISEQKLNSIEIDATVWEMCLLWRPLRDVRGFWKLVTKLVKRILCNLLKLQNCLCNHIFCAAYVLYAKYTLYFMWLDLRTAGSFFSPKAFSLPLCGQIGSLYSRASWVKYFPILFPLFLKNIFFLNIFSSDVWPWGCYFSSMIVALFWLFQGDFFKLGIGQLKSYCPK